MIRLTVPSIGEDDLQGVSEVLRSGLLVQGQRVAAFERAVADYVGTEYAVAVSNCTAALHLALLSLGVQSGDLVIVTAFSYVATANVIELCGAKPVFVDIRPDTFNIDPDCLSEALGRLMTRPESRRRVKAILPVHTFGQMADMPAILEIANRYELPVIEDAACALGATLKSRQAGSWGFVGCFSFHPRKAVTTGEGGVITTRDSKLAEHLRALRNHGQDSTAESPDFIMPGFNYRMTEFQAALGLTQMTKLERIIAGRRRAASVYDRLLAGTSLKAPFVAPHSQHVYQSYVALLPEPVAPRRGDLIRDLKAQGIETNLGTWHIPMTTYYQRTYGYRPGDFPVSDDVFARTLTLPLHEMIRPSEQEEVVRALESFCNGME
ncbi:MAG: DegT/DnrJ/EryC1/StrS family aminotransferase [Acidobacteriota bacterium]|nr:DegT/DnrJ/EryC1/StrS family aminotransferase [Acidobacteriota bacterium]